MYTLVCRCGDSKNQQSTRVCVMVSGNVLQPGWLHMIVTINLPNFQNGDPQALLASIDDLEYDSKRVQQYISDTKKYLEPKDAQIAQIQTTQRSLEALLAEKTNRVKQLGNK